MHSERLEAIYPPNRELVVSFATYFNNLLSIEWEYYIQPSLNGLKPDLIMLHPTYGIVVVEFETIASDGSWKRKWSHLEMIAKEISEIYCPRLGFSSRNRPVLVALVDPLNNWYQSINSKFPIHDLKEFLENLNNNSELRDSEDLLHDLRQWLIEPDSVKERREPLMLDKNQKVLATTRNETGFRRISGPAGSGKSLVLAARAANLISEGKNVAVFSYNITLINYLSHLAICQNSRARTTATWLDFFLWFKRLCVAADMSEEHKSIFRYQGFPSDEKIVELATKALNKLPKIEVQIFDAILVDEGQDFSPKWWQLLRLTLREGGEMLLVADATQDVYGKTQLWTPETTINCGFRGKWVKLNTSYRLPIGMLRHIQEFGRINIRSNEIDLPVQAGEQNALGLESFKARWIQVNSEKDRNLNIITEEVMQMLAERKKQEQVSVFDVTLLVQTKNTGASIVRSLVNQYKIPCATTYGDPKNERSEKMGFGLGDYSVRATTIHSYKGWESRAIVLVIERAQNERNMALIYAGLTRLKWHPYGSFITVICFDSRLTQYGRSWRSFHLIDD